MYLFAIVNAILMLAQIPIISAQGTWDEQWKLNLEKHRNWCAATSYCRRPTDLFPLEIKAEYEPHKGRLLTPQEGCGISGVANARIVGGEMAKIGAYPWMALVGFRRGYDHISFHCGGSLITSRHVMTAGHCFPTGTSPQLTYVRLGEHDLSTTSDGLAQDIEVNYIDVPPGHDPAILHNNIAILTLSRDVKFSNRIRPICLPLNNEFQGKSFVNTNAFVAGWGRLIEDGFLSNVLVDVQVPFIDTATCVDIYKKIYPNHIYNDGMICAGSLAGGKGSCKGDAGGPLMVPMFKNNQFPMYQVGIVSYALGCARTNAPTVYTRVEYFMDWIKAIVNRRK